MNITVEHAINVGRDYAADVLDEASESDSDYADASTNDLVREAAYRIRRVLTGAAADTAVEAATDYITEA